MQLPNVTETSALSAHRREVELVRLSLVAVPEQQASRPRQDPADPLRKIDAATLHAPDAEAAAPGGAQADGSAEPRPRTPYAPSTAASSSSERPSITVSPQS